MRLILYAIFFYCLYLFLRFLVRIYANHAKSSQKLHHETHFRRKQKIDPDQIEDAEFEEIKKSDTEKKD